MKRILTLTICFLCALGTWACTSLKDFENLLDTLSRPMGSNANFGVIDAEGGCAYYEVGNEKYVKYDVNDPNVAPVLDKGEVVIENARKAGKWSAREMDDYYTWVDQYLTEQYNVIF